MLNWGNERRELFEVAADYDAFLWVLAQTPSTWGVRLLAYCVMPSRCHLVVRPEVEGDLGRFMQRPAVTHVRRWREHGHSVEPGHLYHRGCMSFPVQEDERFAVLCRYVGRTGLRAIW